MEGEEREVAVKSLADGSTEEKCIQFLQEAAIMGQFKHPNVITMFKHSNVVTFYGVVMERELVMNYRVLPYYGLNTFEYARRQCTVLPNYCHWTAYRIKHCFQSHLH